MPSPLFSADNNVHLLVCGQAFFPKLIAAIDSASTSIYFETYILRLDNIGQAVCEALIRADQRGVSVSVIIDWLGTGDKGCRQIKALFKSTTIHFRQFNPWFRRGWARSHRKLCVVDHQIAFVGGININDDFISDRKPYTSLPFPRWDFAVQIKGSLAYAIEEEMKAQWVRVNSHDLIERWEYLKRILVNNLHKPKRGLMHAAFVVRDNLRNRRMIEQAYLSALGKAKKTALFTNPYFAPGRKLRTGFQEAARRGVEVILVLGVGQVKTQDAITRAYYPELLTAGVKIIEYRKTQLHAKVAVIDERWSTVGSSNIDGFSLFVNQEANVVISDVSFAKKLKHQIELGIADGVVVCEETYKNIPWFKRAWYPIALRIYRGIMGLITRHLN